MQQIWGSSIFRTFLFMECAMPPTQSALHHRQHRVGHAAGLVDDDDEGLGLVDFLRCENKGFSVM